MKRWLIALLCPALMMGSFGGCNTPPPTVDGATLVTLGDSITALSTWPKDTASLLNMNLVNAGVGGHTTEHGLWRFERDVADAAPDFVIISFGSNDFYRPDGTDPRVSVEDYQANLETMVAKTKALGAVPILMTPPFISPTASGGAANYPERNVNEALDRYVEAMRLVAKQQNIDLIDMHAVCDDGQTVNTFLCADGVHLSDLGNRMYKQTICDYMNTHFKRDPSIPKVTVPTAPPLQQGAWTAPAMSFDAADWRTVFPDTIRTEATDNGITFTAIESGWPEIHYSPAITDSLTIKVADAALTIDAELVAACNISLFFNGVTPTLAYSDTYVPLADVLKTADPSLKISGSDIGGGQRIQCTIPMKDIVPMSFIAADGTVVLSGVKVFVVGGTGTSVTIREFHVTATP